MELLFFTLHFWLKRFRSINEKNDNKYKTANKKTAKATQDQIESEK